VRIARADVLVSREASSAQRGDLFLNCWRSGETYEPGIRGHAQPKLIEPGQQKAGRARFLKSDLIPKAAEIGNPGKMHA
jgi:hypothetical protein